jgi:hypothetical protein
MFRNLTYLGQYSNRAQIRENLTWRLREAFINIGAYYNISSGTKSFDGSEMAVLKPSYRPELHNSSGFKFWQGLSSDWVWENASPAYTGGTNPIQVSGIFINDTFYPTGTTGTYEYYVDYARGGVVFTNALTESGNTIYCNRSERAVFVYPTKSSQYKLLFTEHLKRFENYTPGSGVDSIPNELRSFMPAIFIDVSQSNGDPLQLGDINKLQNFSIALDIVSEDPGLHDTIVDATLALAGQGVKMFDVDKAIENRKYPLDYKGQVENRISADQLYALYPWKTGRFDYNPTEIEGYTALPIYKSTVVFDFEIVT